MKTLNYLRSGIRKYGYILFTFLILLTSCEMFEYSPNQEFDRNTPQQVNRRNIEKLLSRPNTDDTIRIVFTGDSQRFYDEAELLKNKVNSMKGIDMVILAGDISDFGLLNEFEWVHGIFSQMQAPYIAVIGNHDIIANGDNIYRRMYGELDFSFVYDSVKFVFHNSNSREYEFNGNVPDIDWLANECREQAGVSNIVAVSHVPPFNGDFDERLVEPYTSLFRTAPGMLVSLHGHLHDMTDGYPYYDGIRYINSNSVEKRRFILLEISRGRLIKTMIDY